jgi:diacylglycerol kinase (ATP)
MMAIALRIWVTCSRVLYEVQLNPKIEYNHAMPKAYLVYNPSAGRFPSRLLTERAADVLRSRGWEMHLEQTQGGPHITQLAGQAVEQEIDVFFVAGGDGSINYAVKGLMGSETALGVLPAGTANVWAQELGLPGLGWTRWMALEESARQLATAATCKVDLGLCNSSPFLLWAGAGLDAFVVHRIEPRSRWEKHFALAHYAAVAVQQASFWGGMNLNVLADDVEVTGRYILAVVSNIHLYAGGHAEISPAACLDDGRMDLWLFAGETLFETLRHAWDLFSGRHLQSDQTCCIPFHKLRLSSDSPLHVQVDGEPLPIDGDVVIEVAPKALQVLIPKDATRQLFLEDVHL